MYAHSNILSSKSLYVFYEVTVSMRNHFAEAAGVLEASIKQAFNIVLFSRAPSYHLM